MNPPRKTCKGCRHLLQIHRDGQCRAWLTLNQRCPCTHRAAADAHDEVQEVLR